jgi:hypothetical protein
MRTSETGWSNDLPDSPGWYCVARGKEWRWSPSEIGVYPVRVDYYENQLAVVEDPEWEHCDDLPCPHPLEYSGIDDQHWMRRAYKKLDSLDDFHVHDYPDVIGLAGYAPNELNRRPNEQAKINAHFVQQIKDLCK